MDGIKDASHRRSAREVFVRASFKERGGLVFVDTTNGKPPGKDNLAVLELPVNYVEGLFFVNAHVLLRKLGSGRSIQALSPPTEGTTDSSSRQSVTLSSIHLNGILSVSGQIEMEGHPKIFGAIQALQGFTGSGEPEVWYNADLQSGNYSGLPTVMILKGSWFIF